MADKNPVSTNDAESAAAAAEAAERQLIGNVADKDRDAFAELYTAYRPRLIRFLQRLVTQQTQIDEVVNDVMFAVWQGASRFSGRSRVSTWIFGIAHHKVLKAIERWRRAQGMQISADVDLEASHADPTDAISQADRQEWIHAGLQRLSPAQRLTVEYAFYMGYSYQEIADIEGCPVGTVKTRMFHARRNLKDILSQLAPRGNDDHE